MKLKRNCPGSRSCWEEGKRNMGKKLRRSMGSWREMQRLGCQLIYLKWKSHGNDDDGGGDNDCNDDSGNYNNEDSDKFSSVNLLECLPAALAYFRQILKHINTKAYKIK